MASAASNHNGLRPLVRKYLGCICATSLASGLLISGSIHLAGPIFFLEGVLQYNILPSRFTWLFSAFVINGMIVLGICIALNVFRQGAYLISIAFFVCFSIAQLVAYFSGLGISCGCFGPSKEVIGLQSISVPIVFAVVAALGFSLKK